MPARYIVKSSLRRTICILLIVCTLLPGCVRRRMMVRTNPPGALVYVDNQLVGTTPCATDFVYYGTRELRLVKPGFETLTVNQPIPAPWYEIPPLDFASENLVPRKIQDFRTLSYNLTPQVIVPTEQLLDRGEELRRSTLQGSVLPAETTAIPSLSAPALPLAVGEILPPGAASTPAEPQMLEPQSPQLSPAGTLPPGGQPLVPNE